tara:strand:+ start:189 stop:302 length:114 start_codon:yes stop_codon:yes gene_type:complete
MQRENGAIVYLYYDLEGPLHMVADATGNMIKEMLYTP